MLVSLPGIAGSLSPARPVAAPTPGAPVAAGAVVFHPRYRAWLGRQGVSSAADVAGLAGEIVCGHPDRHVARVDLGPPGDRRTVFLKREHVVGIRSRVRNRLAGYGPVSRSEREAIVLDRLERAGLAGPQWLAHGEDEHGHGFLLVDSVPDAREFRAVVADRSLGATDRRRVAETIGRTLAELHEAGFGTPELAGKHVFVSRTTFAVTLLDWQSTPRPGPVAVADRVRQLAKLNASLADAAVAVRDRLRVVWAYFRVVRIACRKDGRPLPIGFARFARRVIAETPGRRSRSSVRDQQCGAPAVDQRLVWLAGEAACVVPDLCGSWPADPTAAPFYPTPDEPTRPVAEEWLTFPDDRRTLLTRYRTFAPVGRLVAAVRERPWRSPAARDARLLFHLQRYGIDAPALLAFGQKAINERTADSFCLVDPIPDGIGLFDRVDDRPDGSGERRAILARSRPTPPRPAQRRVPAEPPAAGGRVLRLPDGPAVAGRRRISQGRPTRPPGRRPTAVSRSRLAVQSGRSRSQTGGLRTDHCRIFWSWAGRPAVAESCPRTGRPMPSLAPWNPVRSLVRRLVRGRRIVHALPEWAAVAGPGWADRVMAEPVTDRFHAKQGRTIARWTLSGAGQTVVVYLKRHYQLPRWRGLLGVVRPGRPWSPGLEEWANLEYARGHGIPVPRAMAVGESLGPWGKLQGFLAVEELAGMIGLHEAVPQAARALGPETFEAWKRGLTTELARLSRELHRRRAFHKDLYFCHFYVREQDIDTPPSDWVGRVVMIDFHRLGVHPISWAWWQAKDLAQLWHSSDVPGVTGRDRARFWRAYRAAGWGTATPPPGWLRTLVGWKYAIYRRNHARRAARAATTAPTAREEPT